MADLRIVDAPVLLQESITDDVKMPTGGLGNYAIRLGDLVWYVVAKENLASKSYVDTSSKGVKDELDIHVSDNNNPHKVTKEQVGLGNVDNTADIDKPVSNATKSAIITATTDMATKTYVNQKDNLKADKATTLSGYGITDAYTKDEINTSISLKADTSYVDGKSGDLTVLTTTDKSSLVKAVNEVNDKTALFYNTVADMVADTKLKAGKAVITHGYYTPNDGGGARYLIKDTATDYSIPVANNLHAAFADSFDIRKFGIRNNATLDQTTEIQRMVNYADSRIYEIDFLNFSLMTPKIVQFNTGRSVLVGMGFRKVHHLKNLTIANNKTEQLVQGTSPIMFLADDPNGRGLFKLSNIKFDPYVSNFKINNGEGDGMMFGFSAGWHKDAGLAHPTADRTLTNYEIGLDNIEFLSPAISYNLACSIFTRNIKANNVRGDYWGIMLVHNTYNLDANNIHGIFRNDLHTGSGRLLVTNLIHEEAEIADDGVITRNNISIKNSSCYKKTDNSIHVVYKCHRIGSITINKFIGDNNIGWHTFYSGADEASKRRLTIKNLEIKNIELVNFDGFACFTEVALFKNINVMNANIIDNAIFGNLTVDGVKVLKKALSIGSTGIVDSLIVKNIDSCLDETYGVVRSGAVIKTIELTNVTCNQNKLIDCSFDTIKLDNVKSTITKGLNYFISSASSNAVNFTINNSQIICTSGALIAHPNNASDKVEFNNTTLIGNLFYDVSRATPHVFNNCKLTKLFSCDPPSIPANSYVKVNLQFLPGARIGDTVLANFSNYNGDVVITASVYDADSIVVRFTNTSANPIDLPSGTLTVKIV